MMQSGSGSSSRAHSTPTGSSTPKGDQVQATKLDIYRPLASQISACLSLLPQVHGEETDHQRPIQPLVPCNSAPDITDLLSLRASAYKQKVQNKPLNFTPAIQTNTDESKAVIGRKKNRGDDDAREAARSHADEKRENRERVEIPARKKRKRAAVEAGHEIQYERIKPLHHLHTIYLSNLLNLPPLPEPSNGEPSTGLRSGLNLGGLGGSTDSIHSKLSKADFTGAHLSVTSARNSSLVGISGLVIEETASTFRLVTVESAVKVIPKNGTQFAIIFPSYAPPTPTSSRTIDLDEGSGEGGESYQSTIIPISPDVMEEYMRTTPRISVPLIGTNFGFRSGDRAGRKFRPTQGGGGGSGWGEEWVVGEWSETLALLGEEKEERNGKKGNGKGGKRVMLESGVPVKRRRGKSRRKDPPAFGSLEVS